MTTTQEKSISFSNTIEDQIFEVASISLHDDAGNSYSEYKKKFQYSNYQIQFFRSELLTKVPKSLNDNKTIRTDVMVTHVKILPPDLRKVKSNFLEELNNILKFLWGNNKSTGFDLGKVEKKFQELRGLYPYSFTLTSFSASVAMGFLSAYFLSKMAKSLSLIIGAYLLSLQALSANGLVTINWEKTRKYIEFFSCQQIFQIFGLSTMGFSLGFYFGMKKELKKMF